MHRRTYSLATFVTVVATSACAVPFSQNIGPTHRIRDGMTEADVIQILKDDPVERVSERGIEEWRYCATRDTSDVVVVLYFRQGQIVDKDTFTIDPVMRRPPPLTRDSRHVESCLDNLVNLYTDQRKPPRKIRELRGEGR